MKNVVLIFPDTAAMVEFVLTQKIVKSKSNTKERTLKGLMNDQQIEIACTKYNAELKQISRYQ